MSSSNKCRGPSGAESLQAESTSRDDELKLKMSFPSGGEGLEHLVASAELIRRILEPMVHALVERVVERMWVRSILGDAIGVPITTAAEVLRCKESKIYELLLKGSLRRVPKHGKETLISLASIKELLEAVPPKRGKRKKGNGGGGGCSNGSALAAGVVGGVAPPRSTAEPPAHAPGEEIRKLSI